MFNYGYFDDFGRHPGNHLKIFKKLIGLTLNFMTILYDVGVFIELKGVLNSFRSVYNKLPFVILR